jgi:hypothetical protein
MSEIIQGEWDVLITRHDLRGRKVRVIVLDEQSEGEASRDDPWLKSLRAWADSHQPLGHPVDDCRESIYSGTADDPR